MCQLFQNTINIMRSIYIIICVALGGLFVSCSEDELIDSISSEQRELIGTAVNFNASISDAYSTRTSYDINGKFNDDDIMTIYRQYYGTTDFDGQNEVFRVYHYKQKYATGNSNISLGRDWIVAGDKTGFLRRLKGDYSPSGNNERTLTISPQTDADSLTWENGKTLRFRAWSRSNLAGALTNTKKEYYYPDFEVSDWVNVSGPTNEIPLTLKHIGSRILFMYKNSGTRLMKIEITTDPADYARKDNAASNTDDAGDKFPKVVKVNGEDVEYTAEQAAQAVADVYNRMCMPAGVDIESGTLKGMTREAYNATTDFSHIEEWDFTPEGKAKLVPFNTKSPDYIKTYVQRPVFTSTLDSRCYMITIPYDMSYTDSHGEILTLPSWTRFRVWLYDVNGGDEAQQGERESEYHIFALDDIREGSEALYKDGLQMKPGFSYEFKVGYRYETLKITPGENPSWIDQDAEIVSTADADVQPEPTTDKYEWWKRAIADAIPRGQENYQPEFHITSEEQFIEFAKLVNGTAGEYGKNHNIYRLVKEYKTITNKDGTISKEPQEYGWSRVNDQQNPEWEEKEVLEAEGYVFYENYHPADGDNKAYSDEDYLQGAYPFYDNNLGRHFTVYLDVDLDFEDIKLSPVGTDINRFQGYFDGAPVRTIKLDTEGNYVYSDSDTDPRLVYDEVVTTTVHTIRNLNVEGGYLFGYVKDAAIRNLMIESYHTIGLLNTANPSMDGNREIGWGCYILGVSIMANNKAAVGQEHNAIAHSLSGRSFVVGCIHEGDAAGALVGSADNLTMFGCMRTASNISGGALMGHYPNPSNKYLKALVSLSNQRSNKNFRQKPNWGRFMCNFYNKDIREDSKDATAIGGEADDYSLLEYIRGRKSRILRAQNDNLLGKEVNLASLSDQQQEEFYGLAPWKAMNYAIYKYNTDPNYYGKDHPCKVHYEVETVGYDHTYPKLKSGAPENYGQWNVLAQNN